MFELFFVDGIKNFTHDVNFTYELFVDAYLCKSNTKQIINMLQ